MEKNKVAIILSGELLSKCYNHLFPKATATTNTYLFVSSKHVVAVYFDAFVKLISRMHHEYHKIVVKSWK